MRVLYMGEIVPEDTTSGAKVIHRHLHLLAKSHEVFVAHWRPVAVPGVRFIALTERPWAHRALGSRRRRHFAALDSTLGFRCASGSIAAAFDTARPNVVLTVADGGLCYAAEREARRRRLPTAVFFHDWSPDWRLNPGWSRGLLDRAFRRLYRRSSKPLCVSSGMREIMPPHAGAEILPPIPDPAAPAPSPLDPRAPGPLLYTGVFNSLYEHEVRLLAASSVPAGLALEFLGPDPHWGDPVGERFLRAGPYRGMRRGGEFRAALDAAAALLVIMPFGTDHRRFSVCSFPSKLTEYCAVGRPVVIWAPAYSSAARWAAESDAALCVTDPSPDALLSAAAALARDPAQRADLAARARRQYERQFLPSLLQARFESALTAVRNPCA